MKYLGKLRNNLGFQKTNVGIDPLDSAKHSFKQCSNGGFPKTRS